MFPAALVALMVGGPLGACLFLAYGVMHALKIAKVDAKYADKGEAPPSYALINRWLDRKKAAGTVPKNARPAKYGMWRYAWQRWQAMWEDMGVDFAEQRAADKKARAEAKEKGLPVPPRRTVKDKAQSLKSWKWWITGTPEPAAAHIEPAISAAEQSQVAAVADEPRTACEDCGQTLVQRSGGWHHPSSAGCPVPSPQPSPLGSFSAEKPATPVRKERDGSSPTSPGDTDALFARPAVVPVPLWAHAKTMRLTCPQCGTRTVLDSGSGNYAYFYCPRCGDVVESCGWEAVAKDAKACHRCGGKHPAGIACTAAAPAPRTGPTAPTGTAPGPTKGNDMPNTDPDESRDSFRDSAEHHILSNTPGLGDAMKKAATDTNGGSTMTITQPGAPTTAQQSGEVVGLMSAINYAGTVAAAHEAHSTGGGEGYRASLAQAEVGPETIQSAAEAQEASQIAAGAWRRHAEKLREQLAAKEATTSETGKKEFLLAE